MAVLVLAPNEAVTRAMNGTTQTIVNITRTTHRTTLSRKKCPSYDVSPLLCIAPDIPDPSTLDLFPRVTPGNCCTSGSCFGSSWLFHL